MYPVGTFFDKYPGSTLTKVQVYHSTKNPKVKAKVIVTLN